eukprot:scaffold615288_cov41-Prasinocladus_malaysianus.AAC.1
MATSVETGAGKRKAPSPDPASAGADAPAAKKAMARSGKECSHVVATPPDWDASNAPQLDEELHGQCILLITPDYVYPPTMK